MEKTTLFYAKESLVFENGILGEGAFGVVKKAVLTTSDSSRVVAVKSLKGTYVHTCMRTCMHTYVHTYIRTYMHTCVMVGR